MSDTIGAAMFEEDEKEWSSQEGKYVAAAPWPTVGSSGSSNPLISISCRKASVRPDQFRPTPARFGARPHSVFKCALFLPDVI